MFRGRIDRKGYLLGHVYIFLVLIFLALLTGLSVVIFRSSSSNASSGIAGTLLLVVSIMSIFLYIPGTLGLGIRRFHDMNLSAWWVLLYLVPFVGTITPWALLFIRGTASPNKYGERLSPRDFDRVLFGPRPKDPVTAISSQDTPPDSPPEAPVSPPLPSPNDPPASPQI